MYDGIYRVQYRGSIIKIEEINNGRESGGYVIMLHKYRVNVVKKLFFACTVFHWLWFRSLFLMASLISSNGLPHIVTNLSIDLIKIVLITYGT